MQGTIRGCWLHSLLKRLLTTLGNISFVYFSWSSVLQLHLRRFLLSPKAVELFWADSPEVFLAFEGVHQRQAFTRALRKQHVPMLPATTLYGSLHPRKVRSEELRCVAKAGGTKTTLTTPPIIVMVGIITLSLLI